MVPSGVAIWDVYILSRKSRVVTINMESVVSNYRGQFSRLARGGIEAVKIDTRLQWLVSINMIYTTRYRYSKRLPAVISL